MVVFKKNCCPCRCSPRTIASFVTNRDNPIWNLTPYQGVGIGTRCGFWRLIEVAYPLIYNTGRIDENGTLVGLPSQFRSDQYYDGFMELQQGCCDDNSACCDDWYVNWP